MPTTYPPKPYMDIIEGKEKARALQLSTRDPLEFRDTRRLSFQPVPSLSHFPGCLRSGPHGPERPCSVPRAVTLTQVASRQTPSGSWDPCPFQGSLFSSQDRGVSVLLPPWQEGWLGSSEDHSRDLCFLSHHPLASAVYPADCHLFRASFTFRPPTSPLIASGYSYSLSSC